MIHYSKGHECTNFYSCIRGMHNSHVFINVFTKITKDCEIVLKFECADRSEALFLESFIKRMKSGKFTEKIIDNPKILAEILLKHR